MSGPRRVLRLDDLERIVSAGPDGMTPLCAALRDLVAEITRQAPELRRAQKTVAVIIASDGEVGRSD
jgi:Mg-chelatase subunit ChlD